MRAIESKITVVGCSFAFMLIMMFYAQSRRLKKALNTRAEVYLDTSVIS